MSGPWVLGISASHNGAVCLLNGDRVEVAIQEERLTRQKRQRLYLGRPSLAIPYCLQAAGIGAQDLAMVAGCVQGSSDGPEHDLSLQPQLRVGRYGTPTRRIGHHLGHAISAFATSGLPEAAVLVIDGAGSPVADLDEQERRALIGPADGFETISLYHAEGTELRALEKHVCARGDWWVKAEAGMGRFHSLGGIFTAVADLMFDDGLEAGKVMGLAPYGAPDIPVEDFFTLDGPQFIFHPAVPARFKDNDRWPQREREYQALAASAQRALESAVLHLTARLRAITGSNNLCYAGGVALNSIANERIVREAGFKQVYIMPAAEDSGPAVGAAYAGLWSLTGRNSRVRLTHDSLGRAYSAAQIAAAVAKTPAVRALAADDLLGEAAARLASGQIAGWFQGGAELGPRALGQRSILCDPRRPDGKDLLNRRVKHREGFRPFAPAILREHARDWFELGDVTDESPFMLRVCRFRSGSNKLVPAVAHVDNTGRLQTVTAAHNGAFHALISRFHAVTGVPMLLNTSYNVMGEPIVETPEDALWDMLYTGIDFAVLGDRLVVRDPDYVSPLELVPYVAAHRVSFNALVGQGRLELAAVRNSAIWCEVSTPWGSLPQPVPPQHLPVLQLIDGRSNGLAIYDRLLATDAVPGLSREALVRALAYLRRCSIITFTRASAEAR